MGNIGYNTLVYNTKNTLSSSSDKMKFSGTIKRSSNYTTIGDTSIISCEPTVTSWAKGVKKSEPWTFNETSGFTRTFAFENLSGDTITQNLVVGNKNVLSFNITQDLGVHFTIYNTGDTVTLRGINDSDSSEPTLYLYCSKYAGTFIGGGNLNDWINEAYRGGGEHYLVGYLAETVTLTKNTSVDVKFQIVPNNNILTIANSNPKIQSCAAHMLSIRTSKHKVCPIKKYTLAGTDYTTNYHVDIAGASFFSSTYGKEYQENIQNLNNRAVFELGIVIDTNREKPWYPIETKEYNSVTYTLARQSNGNEHSFMLYRSDTGGFKYDIILSYENKNHPYIGSTTSKYEIYIGNDNVKTKVVGVQLLSEEIISLEGFSITWNSITPL